VQHAHINKGKSSQLRYDLFDFDNPINTYSLQSYLYRVAQKERMFFIFACDFFLWGYLNSKVYVRKPCIVDNLKFSLHEEIATVPQEMLVNVMQNFEERLHTCVRQEGLHLSYIIFRN